MSSIEPCLLLPGLRKRRPFLLLLSLLLLLLLTIWIVNNNNCYNGLYVNVFRPQLAGAVAVEWRLNKFQVEQAGILREI